MRGRPGSHSTEIFLKRRRELFRLEGPVASGPLKRAGATMNRYKVTKQLGDGTYGSVLKAVNRQSGEVVRPDL